MESEDSLSLGSKVCLCTTNCHLSHKDPYPKGVNHSEVVIKEQRNDEKKEYRQARRQMYHRPRWDRWHIRIPNPEDQKKLIELYRKSGAKTKSDFLRARLLDESFKVIIEDESTEEYYRKLSNITAQIQKIGILYNQTVRAINSYHSVKAAQVMLQRLEQFSQQIITLEQQAISLTLDYRKR